MKRMATAAALLAALAACSYGVASTVSGSAKASAKKTTTITIWVGWSARELRVFKGVVAE